MLKDASLKVPPSIEGVVIDKQLYARAKKDKYQKVQEKDLLTKLEDKHNVAINELKTVLIDKLMKIVKDQVSQGVKSIYGEEMVAKGTKYTNASSKSLTSSKWTI
jgi:DNA-directed RNA polymerase subunit beta